MIAKLNKIPYNQGDMKTHILNYRVIIEPDEETGTDKPTFSAYCPTLGLADYGDTVDEAIQSMTKMIIFHLDCLKEEGQKIPNPDSKIGFITSIQVPFTGRLSHA